MRRVGLGLASAAVVVVIAAAVARPARAHLHGGLCGSGRWAVKTLGDRESSTIDRIPVATTVADLDSLVRPEPIGPERVAPSRRASTASMRG
jgi:hypothetical protein